MMTLFVLDLESEADRAYLRELEINIITMNRQSNNFEINTVNVVAHEETNSFSFGIKVTVHIPNDISPNIKQQKINRIYDILKPKYREVG